MKTETEFDVQEFIDELEQQEGIDSGVLAAYCYENNYDTETEIREAAREVENYYIGEMDIEEYAEQLAQELYPDAYETGYFDVEALARDLRCGGEVYESQGFLFRSY